MNSIITGIYHFIILLVWMYFTHHYLEPRESGWKREIKIIPLWLIGLYISSTYFIVNPIAKSTIYPIFIFLTFFYMYKLNIPRFIYAVCIIFLVALFSEAIFDLIIIGVFKEKLAEFSIISRLTILPFDFLLHVCIFSWIIRKQKNPLVNHDKILLSICILFITQILLSCMVSINIVYDNSIHSIFSLIIITLFIAICNWILWKQKQHLFYYHKQKHFNKQLKHIYQSELSSYMKMKDRSIIQTNIRHDLMNEIQIINYIDHKTS